MRRVPAYKQRRRMRERAAFIAAVQARTQHRPAALGAGCSALVGAVAIHAATVPPECGGASPCDVGGKGAGVVADVSGAAG